MSDYLPGALCEHKQRGLKALNTITKDGLELDRETVEKIRHADGEPVDFQLLATTQTGDLWFLSAQASYRPYKRAGKRIYFWLDGGPPPGVERSDVPARWRESVS